VHVPLGRADVRVPQQPAGVFESLQVGPAIFWI
jgi:hypothetical protein